MRIFTAVLGVVFVISAFTMTSWHWKGEQRKRPPNLWIRAFFFAVGVVVIVWVFRWPF